MALRDKILPKAEFDAFFSALQNLGSVYAPVRVSEKSFSFKKVQSASQIAFDALRTILPPKKFFYPQEESILSWSESGFEELGMNPDFKVIFGVHPCDLAGLTVMDTIYSAEPADSHYMAKRKASLLVGLSCMPDKHCFCNSMGNSCPDGNYDLFLTDIGSDFFIEIRTATALSLLSSLSEHLQECNEEHKEKYKEFWRKREQSFSNGFSPDNIKSVMAMEVDNPLWEELGQRCLSCGNCTPVCPTCYCFDLVDIAELNGKEGVRKRQWDSCQFVGFAKVAGGHNFRPGPVDRLKFWYQHKLHGFDDPYGFRTCVGCGRCTESCPAGIDDIVQVVKILQGEKLKYEVNTPVVQGSCSGSGWDPCSGSGSSSGSSSGSCAGSCAGSDSNTEIPVKIRPSKNQESERTSAGSFEKAEIADKPVPGKQSDPKDKSDQRNRSCKTDKRKTDK